MWNGQFTARQIAHGETTEDVRKSFFKNAPARELEDYLSLVSPTANPWLAQQARVALEIRLAEEAAKTAEKMAQHSEKLTQLTETMIAESKGLGEQTKVMVEESKKLGRLTWALIVLTVGLLALTAGLLYIDWHREAAPQNAISFH
jgi:hypothetical protein